MICIVGLTKHKKSDRVNHLCSATKLSIEKREANSTCQNKTFPLLQGNLNMAGPFFVGRSGTRVCTSTGRFPPWNRAHAIVLFFLVSFSFFFWGFLLAQPFDILGQCTKPSIFVFLFAMRKQEVAAHFYDHPPTWLDRLQNIHVDTNDGYGQSLLTFVINIDRFPFFFQHFSSCFPGHRSRWWDGGKLWIQKNRLKNWNKNWEFSFCFYGKRKA